MRRDAHLLNSIRLRECCLYTYSCVYKYERVRSDTQNNSIGVQPFQSGNDRVPVVELGPYPLPPIRTCVS